VPPGFLLPPPLPPGSLLQPPVTPDLPTCSRLVLSLPPPCSADFIRHNLPLPCTADFSRPSTRRTLPVIARSAAAPATFAALRRDEAISILTMLLYRRLHSARPPPVSHSPLERGGSSPPARIPRPPALHRLTKFRSCFPTSGLETGCVGQSSRIAAAAHHARDPDSSPCQCHCEARKNPQCLLHPLSRRSNLYSCDFAPPAADLSR